MVSGRKFHTKRIVVVTEFFQRRENYKRSWLDYTLWQLLQMLHCSSSEDRL